MNTAKPTSPLPELPPSAVTSTDVLGFARHVADGVRRSRLARLRAGSITDAEAAHDVACADDLVRIAENEVLFSGPPLN